MAFLLLSGLFAQFEEPLVLVVAGHSDAGIFGLSRIRNQVLVFKRGSLEVNLARFVRFCEDLGEKKKACLGLELGHLGNKPKRLAIKTLQHWT